MSSFEDLSKFNGKQTDPVADCLNTVKDWPESGNRKLLFYFFGSAKELKNKLKI